MNAATHPLRIAVTVAICSTVACGGPPGAAAPVPAPQPSAPPAAAVAEPPRPLTDRERVLAARLREEVSALAGDIGERNLGRPFELASATDYLATRLEALGFEVRRTGYRAGDDVLQNLEVVVPGGKRGQEHVLVGAHFDTHAGSPGADDNASGVAATFLLAESFRQQPTARTLRFAFFASEELPSFGTAEMGSLVHAKQLVKEGVRLSAMISVESIGYFSEAPGSQRYPASLEGRYPNVGDFIGVVGNAASSDLVRYVTETFSAAASIPGLSALSDEIAEFAASDHWAFWQIGVPAVMVTDTAPFRNPHYHQASDLPETLDYERAARVVLGLEYVVQGLGNRGVPEGAPTGTVRRDGGESQ